MKKRNTVTFEADVDVAELLQEATNRGRGVRSETINKALRDRLPAVLKARDKYHSKNAT